MKTIPLTKGYIAIVDDCDYERAMLFTWRVGAVVNGKPERVVTGDVPNLVSLGAFILGVRVGSVDHIDRDTLNNTRANLRIATQQQNSFNRWRVGRTGFKGVHSVCTRHSKTIRYQARITRDGLTINLGSFATPNEAAKAYDEAARKLHGEFACTNYVHSNLEGSENANVNVNKESEN